MSIYSSKNIIINADDLGLSSSVNKAIIKSFDDNLITSATLMATMPGFEEAVELIHQKKIASKIGVHLNLTDGAPLTENARSLGFLFKGKSNFKKGFKANIFFMKKNKSEVIYNELSAQIERLRSNHILISHIDSHHHIHEWYSVIKIVFELSKKYNIPSIRILNNMEDETTNYKKIYRNFINKILHKKRLNFSDFFGSVADYKYTLEKKPSLLENKRVEIMVHPDYNAKGDLIDRVGKSEVDFLSYKTYS